MGLNTCRFQHCISLGLTNCSGKSFSDQRKVKQRSTYGLEKYGIKHICDFGQIPEMLQLILHRRFLHTPSVLAYPLSRP